MFSVFWKYRCIQIIHLECVHWPFNTVASEQSIAQALKMWLSIDWQKLHWSSSVSCFSQIQLKLIHSPRISLRNIPYSMSENDQNRSLSRFGSFSFQLFRVWLSAMSVKPWGRLVYSSLSKEDSSLVASLLPSFSSASLSPSFSSVKLNLISDSFTNRCRASSASNTLTSPGLTPSTLQTWSSSSSPDPAQPHSLAHGVQQKQALHLSSESRWL